MTLKEILKKVPGPFKPGYRTGRGVHMIQDCVCENVMKQLSVLGVSASRVPCGHDFNYKGDLYFLKARRSA